MDQHYAFVYLKKESKDINSINFLFFYLVDFEYKQKVEEKYFEISVQANLDQLAQVAEYKIKCDLFSESRNFGCMVFNKRGTILYIKMNFPIIAAKTVPQMSATTFLIPPDYELINLTFNQTKMVVYAKNSKSNENDYQTYKFFVYDLKRERKNGNFPLFSYSPVMFWEKEECFDPNFKFQLINEQLIISTGSSISGCQESIYKIYSVNDYRLINNCASVECLELIKINYSDETQFFEKTLVDLMISTKEFKSDSNTSDSKKTVNLYVITPVIVLLALIVIKTKSVHDKKKKHLEDIMNAGIDSRDYIEIDSRQLILERGESVDIVTNPSLFEEIE